MVYKEIADLVWNGLVEDMDTLSALEDFAIIIDEVPVTDEDLIKALKDKLCELRERNDLSECCGAEIKYEEHKEHHDELDRWYYEVVSNRVCSECGRNLD